MPFSRILSFVPLHHARVHLQTRFFSPCIQSRYPHPKPPLISLRIPGIRSTSRFHVIYTNLQLPTQRTISCSRLKRIRKFRDQSLPQPLLQKARIVHFKINTRI